MDPTYLECPVCLSLFADPVLLLCGHSFCKACVQNLVARDARKSLECPECRTLTHLPTGVQGLPVNWAIKRCIDSLPPTPESNLPSSPDSQPSSSGNDLSRSFSSFDSSDIWAVCSQHEVQASLFCFDCKAFLCEACCAISSDHFGHRQEPLPTSLSNLHDDVFDVSVNLGSCADKFNEAIGRLRSIQELLSQGSADQVNLIRSTISKGIVFLQQREREMLAQSSIHMQKSLSKFQADTIDHQNTIMKIRSLGGQMDMITRASNVTPFMYAFFKDATSTLDQMESTAVSPLGAPSSFADALYRLPSDAFDQAIATFADTIRDIVLESVSLELDPLPSSERPVLSQPISSKLAELIPKDIKQSQPLSKAFSQPQSGPPKAGNGNHLMLQSSAKPSHPSSNHQHRRHVTKVQMSTTVVQPARTLHFSQRELPNEPMEILRSVSSSGTPHLRPLAESPTHPRLAKHKVAPQPNPAVVQASAVQQPSTSSKAPLFIRKP